MVFQSTVFELILKSEVQFRRPQKCTSFDSDLVEKFWPIRPMIRSDSHKECSKTVNIVGFKFFSLNIITEFQAVGANRVTKMQTFRENRDNYSPGYKKYMFTRNGRPDKFESTNARIKLIVVRALKSTHQFGLIRFRTYSFRYNSWGNLIANFFAVRVPRLAGQFLLPPAFSAG